MHPADIHMNIFCCARSATAKRSLVVKAQGALEVRIVNSLVRTVGEQAKMVGVPQQTGKTAA